MISLGSSELRRTTEEEGGGRVVFFSRFTWEEKQEVKNLNMQAGRSERSEFQESLSSSSSASPPPPGSMKYVIDPAVNTGM